MKLQNITLVQASKEITMARSLYKDYINNKMGIKVNASSGKDAIVIVSTALSIGNETKYCTSPILADDLTTSGYKIGKSAVQTNVLKGELTSVLDEFTSVDDIIELAKSSVSLLINIHVVSENGNQSSILVPTAHAFELAELMTTIETAEIKFDEIKLRESLMSSIETASMYNVVEEECLVGKRVKTIDRIKKTEDIKVEFNRNDMQSIFEFILNNELEEDDTVVDFIAKLRLPVTLPTPVQTEIEEEDKIWVRDEKVVKHVTMIDEETFILDPIVSVNDRDDIEPLDVTDMQSPIWQERSDCAHFFGTKVEEEVKEEPVVEEKKEEVKKPMKISLDSLKSNKATKTASPVSELPKVANAGSKLGGLTTSFKSSVIVQDEPVTTTSGSTLGNAISKHVHSEPIINEIKEEPAKRIDLSFNTFKATEVKEEVKVESTPEVKLTINPFGLPKPAAKPATQSNGKLTSMPKINLGSLSAFSK